MLKETKILLKAHFVYFCPVLSNLLIFKHLSEVCFVYSLVQLVEMFELTFLQVLGGIVDKKFWKKIKGVI